MVQPDFLEAALRARSRNASCLARCAGVLCAQAAAQSQGCKGLEAVGMRCERLQLLRCCVVALLSAGSISSEISVPG